MNKILISVYDRKAETWSLCSPTDNKATAIRDFSALVRDNRTMIGMHPEDFDLYQVAEFDPSLMAIVNPSKSLLINGAQLVPQPKE